MNESNHEVNPAGEGKDAEHKDNADVLEKRKCEILIALGIGELEAEMRKFQKLRQLPLESEGDAGDVVESGAGMPQSGRMFQVDRLQDNEPPGGDNFPLDDLDELSFF